MHPETRNHARVATAAWGAVSLLTFLVFLSTVRNGFVNWDDNEYVYANPHLTPFDSRFITWAFTTFHSSNWHPLTWLSHGVDVLLWGLDPAGHHLANILIHSANTFLVGLAVFHLLGGVVRPSTDGKPAAKGSKKAPSPVAVPGSDPRVLIPSLVAALLFGIHPLHVESVAWISERKDVLSTFFMLLSTAFYVRHALRERQRREWKRAGPLLLSLLFFALALLSKPMPLTLPVVFLLLDVYPLRRMDHGAGSGRLRAVILEKIPFLALSAASAAVTLMAQTAGGAVGTLESHPLSTRILVAVQAVFSYLLRAVVPASLSPLYPYPGPGEVSLLSPGYLFSVAAFVFAGIACIYLWKRGRKAWPAAWLSYLILLSPVLGVVHFGPQASADRYTYATLLPALVLAGVGYGRLIERVRDRKILLAAALVSSVAVVCTLGWLSVRQGRVWRDSLSLWNRVLELYPDSALAYNRRGDAHLTLGQEDRALADLTRSIELSGGVFEPSLHRRARILLRMGRTEEALKDADAAINARPDRADSYNVRGAILMAKGELKRAVEDFSLAIRLNPGLAEALTNRGSALRSLGELDRARQDFDRAIELDPGSAAAFSGRGMLLGSTGEFDRALADLNRAIELRGDSAEAYLNRCEILRRRSRFDEALADCSRAVELAGRSAQAHNLLGQVLFSLGRAPEALQEFDRAAGISPGEAEAWFNRAVAERSLGRKVEALENYSRAIRLDPRYLAALGDRGTLLGEMGRWREAIGDFDAVIALDPGNAQGYYNRGVTKYASGDRAGGVEDLRKAAQLGDRDVQQRLTRMGIR